MLSRKQLMNTLVRNLCLLNNYFLRQLPHEIQARFDPEQLATAFSFLEENEERVNVEPWLSAPTGYSRQAPSNVSATDVDDSEDDIDAKMTDADRASHMRRFQCLERWATHSMACGKFFGSGQDLLAALEEGIPEYKKRKPTASGEFYHH